MSESLQPGNAENIGFKEILEKLESLETRLVRIENSSGVVRYPKQAAWQSNQAFIDSKAPVNDGFITIDNAVIESKVFEYGLAWLGSLVMLFGIAFLMAFTQNHWNSLLSSLLGYMAVAGVFFVANFLKSSYRHMSIMLTISGHLLAFYTALRMYFFNTAPLIDHKSIILGLMVITIYVQIFLAVQRKSQVEALIAIILLLFSAIISDAYYFTFPIMILAAATTFFLFVRYSWSYLLITSMVMTYAAHVLWFFGNPLAGHPFAIVTAHHYNFVFLFAYGTIFSLTQLVTQKGLFKDSIFNTVIILTGILFSLLMMMNVVTFFDHSYVPLFTGIFAACFAYSIILKFKINRLFDPSFYACFSYMALSAAIYGLVGLPDAYFLLALQSLLVLSMALWYRSRIIVIMNTLMFLSITTVYLVYSVPLNKINFSLAFTALISARFINWQKQRLDLKTESVRNTYLILAFFAVLFALYHAVPAKYITLSWTAAAVIYFILSVLIRNIKYRYMAILTLLVTAFYLFLVDLKNMEVGFRVIAFLFLAIISIGASLYYTKKIRKKSKTVENDEAQE